MTEPVFLALQLEPSLMVTYRLFPTGLLICQDRSQDFLHGGGGGEGGAYIKKWDQTINVLILRYATSEDTRGGVSNLRSIKLKSGDF